MNVNFPPGRGRSLRAVRLFHRIPTLPPIAIPNKLFNSISYYHDHSKWFPEIALLMPDHLHALISFSWEPGLGMKKTLENWKHYAASTQSIRPPPGRRGATVPYPPKSGQLGVSGKFLRI